MSAVEPLIPPSQQRQEESRDDEQKPYEAGAQNLRLKLEEENAYWEERRRVLREEIKQEADREEAKEKRRTRRDGIDWYYVRMFFTEVGVWIINIAVLGLAAAILAYLPPTSLIIAGSITLATATWQAVRPLCKLSYEQRSDTDARPERLTLLYLVVTPIFWAASAALMFGGYGSELVNDQRAAETIDKRSPLPSPKGGVGGGKGGGGGRGGGRGGSGKPAWKGNLKKVGSSSLAGDAYVACGAVSFGILLFSLFQLWCVYKVYKIYRKERRGETWA